MGQASAPGLAARRRCPAAGSGDAERSRRLIDHCERTGDMGGDSRPGPGAAFSTHEIAHPAGAPGPGAGHAGPAGRWSASAGAASRAAALAAPGAGGGADRTHAVSHRSPATLAALSSCARRSPLDEQNARAGLARARPTTPRRSQGPGPKAGHADTSRRGRVQRRASQAPADGGLAGATRTRWRAGGAAGQLCPGARFERSVPGT